MSKPVHAIVPLNDKVASTTPARVGTSLTEWIKWEKINDFKLG
jgi:hypothetical protein